MESEKVKNWARGLTALPSRHGGALPPTYPLPARFQRRQDHSFHVRGQVGPSVDEAGQVGVGDAPFALLVTTPGGDVRRKLLIRFGVRTRNLRTVDPVVAGSSPVVLVNILRCQTVACGV